MTYYICKLNINENIFTNNFDEIKSELIPEALKSYKQPHPVERILDKDVTLSDINDEIEGIIVGKIYTAINKESNRYNDKTGTTEKETIDDGKTNDFIYLVEDELLLVRITKKELKKSLDRFATLIERTNPEIGELKINPIPEVKELRETILNRTIISFKVTYIAPNDPRTTRDMIGIAEDIHAAKAEELYSGKHGLELTENGEIKPFINNHIISAENGYANIELEDSQKKKISSQKNLACIKDIKEKSIVDRSIINIVKGILRKIKGEQDE